MSNVFKITYFNGAVDHIKLELENIEHVAGQMFGKTIAELESFGGKVELIGKFVPEAEIPVVAAAADTGDTAVSTGTADSTATVSTPPLPVAETTVSTATQDAVVAPPPAPAPAAPWAPKPAA